MTRRTKAILAQMALAAFLVALSALRAQRVSGFVEVRSSETAGVEGESRQTIERIRPTVEVELASRIRLLATLGLAS